MKLNQKLLWVVPRPSAACQIMDEAEKQGKKIEVYKSENSASGFAYRFVDKKVKKVSKK